MKTRLPTVPLLLLAALGIVLMLFAARVATDANQPKWVHVRVHIIKDATEENGKVDVWQFYKRSFHMDNGHQLSTQRLQASDPREELWEAEFMATYPLKGSFNEGYFTIDGHYGEDADLWFIELDANHTSRDHYTVRKFELGGYSVVDEGFMPYKN